MILHCSNQFKCLILPATELDGYIFDFFAFVNFHIFATSVLF